MHSPTFPLPHVDLSPALPDLHVVACMSNLPLMYAGALLGCGGILPTRATTLLGGTQARGWGWGEIVTTPIFVSGVDCGLWQGWGHALTHRWALTRVFLLCVCVCVCVCVAVCVCEHPQRSAYLEHQYTDFTLNLG